MGAICFKKIFTYSAVLICLSLALTQGSANALPMAESTSVIDWESLKITTYGLTISYHDSYVSYDDNKYVNYSEASVRSDTAYDYDKDRKSSTTWVDTAANASITGASAEAKTIPSKLFASVSADADDFNSESWARASADAERWVYFDVKGDGKITLTANYYLSQQIGVNTVNDYAYADSEVWLSLKNKSTGRYEEDWIWIESELGNAVGETKDDNKSGELKISIDYKDGQYGYMWMGAYSKVKVKTEAPSPVPEPASLFLFGFGLACLAGYSRKKFKTNNQSFC
jgi:hypothetical protein